MANIQSKTERARDGAYSFSPPERKSLPVEDVSEIKSFDDGSSAGGGSCDDERLPRWLEAAESPANAVAAGLGNATQRSRPECARFEMEPANLPQIMVKQGLRADGRHGCDQRPRENCSEDEEEQGEDILQLTPGWIFIGVMDILSADEFIALFTFFSG